MPKFKLFNRQIFQKRRFFSRRPGKSSSPQSQTQPDPSHASDLSAHTCCQSEDAQDAPSRSSQKTSAYEPSPVCSEITVAPRPGVLPRSSSEVGSVSSLELDPSLPNALVQVISVGGEETSTITTRPVDEDEPEPAANKSEPSVNKSRRISLHRSKTAPSILHNPPTTESSEKSTPPPSTDRGWGRFNVLRRVRTHAERKEACRGKVEFNATVSPPTEPASKRGGATEPACAFPRGSPRSSYHSAMTNVSPRASVATPPEALATEDRSSVSPSLRQTPAHSRHSSNVSEHIYRKDSHFPDAVQAKDRATAEMQATIQKQLEDAPPDHPKRSSMIRRSVNRLFHHAPYLLATSAFSSSSSSGSDGEDASPPSQQPGTKIARVPSVRNIPSTPACDLQTSREVPEEQDSRDPPLPPGFEVPEYGDAGPSNWMEKSWHQHENMEELRRARMQALAARSAQEERSEERGADVSTDGGDHGSGSNSSGARAKARRSEESVDGGAKRDVGLKEAAKWESARVRFKGSGYVGVSVDRQIKGEEGVEHGSTT